MIDLVGVLANELDKEKPLRSLDRKPETGFYLNPSSSGVYTKNGQPLGACIKQTWLAKKKYPISNPPAVYNKLNFEFGNMIEDWVIDKFKSAGIYLDSNVKLVDNDLNISGEIDILCAYPDTSKKFVVEVKSYNGSNYGASKDVLGSKDSLPKPKDGYILQVVTYLLMLKRYGIDEVYLFYVDKSAKSLYNCKQFRFFLEGSTICYQTLHQGVWKVIKETRFDTNDIIERNKAVIQLLELDVVPDPDYKITYSVEDIEDAFERGEITKTRYEKVRNSGFIEEMGSWQCAYCPYGKSLETGESTCINVNNETKDLYV